MGSSYGYNLFALQGRLDGDEIFTDELDETIAPERSINAAKMTDRYWDIIILSHVLEHFTDPIGLLNSAVAQLNDGGIVVIEVPNDLDGIKSLNGPGEPHLSFFVMEPFDDLLRRVDGRVLGVFAAGPHVRRGPRWRDHGFKAMVRSAVKPVLKTLPIVSGVLDKRKKRVELARDRDATRLDLSNRSPDGVFLRAVLTR